MNPHVSASLRLCAILLVASPAIGAEPLTWKWKAGDKVRYRMTQSMGMAIQAGPAGEVSTAMSQDVLMGWKVEKVADDGAATISQQVERIVMRNKGNAGQGFDYDSDSEDPPAGMAALVAPVFEAMVEHPFRVTMRPSGEATEFQLSDELSKALDRLPGGAVSGDMVTQMSQQSMLKFPAEPLAVGDKWTNTAEVTSPAIGEMKVHTTYTYDGPREVDGRQYEAFTPSIQMEAAGEESQIPMKYETKESTGEILFDRQKGRLFRSRLLQTIEVRVKVGDREIVNTVDQTVEMRELGEDETPTLDAPAEEEAEATPTEEPAATE